MNLLFTWWHTSPKSCSRHNLFAQHLQRTAFPLLCVFAFFSATPSAHSQTTEIWCSIEFDGKAVGYEHVRVQRAEGKANLTCFRRTQIQLKRLGRDLSLSASLWTEQTLAGQLLSFDLQRLDGEGVRLQRSGKLDKQTGTMRISDLRTGARDSYDVPFTGIVYSPIMSTWLPGIVGPSAPRSTNAVFFPESAGIANIVSEYRASQIVKHAGQRQTVTRQNFYPDGAPSKLTTVQISEDGLILRQEKRVFGGVLAIVQSTADAALSANNSVDIDAQALIPVDRIRNFSAAGTHLVLTVKVSRGLLADIPDALFQKAERISDQEIQLTLAPPEERGREVAVTAYRQPPALASTTWMPTHNRELVKLAALAAGPERTPARICERMQKFVTSKMRRSAFSTTILPANEVVRTFRGDCTEHAVLLATLLRIKGIPTRVVSGLVQVENQFGFQGHMWVEAFVNDQWEPFDSASPKQAIRIKLADSELADSSTSGISLFLPVLDLIGRTSVHAEKTSPNGSP